MNAHSVRVHTRAVGHELESRRGLSLGERVAAFLRLRHPVKTADNVSADTGIPVNTVKTWLQRASAPDAEGYTLLWLAYGPDFLAVLADGRAPQWLQQARRDHEAAALKAEIAALKTKLAGVTA
jgi:hypothetical protein